MVFEKVLPPDGKTSIDDELLRRSLSRFMSIATASAPAFDSGSDPTPVLLLPPDFTRYHSYAGQICSHLYNLLPPTHAVTAVMPALGTHAPMTSSQISTMFEGIPEEMFKVHDWRNDVETIGYAPKELVEKASRGIISKVWTAREKTEVNAQCVRLLSNYPLLLVVPLVALLNMLSPGQPNLTSSFSPNLTAW